MTRRAHDSYYTPKSATQALKERVVIKGVILECCVGGGDIAREFLEFNEVITNDIRADVPADLHVDVSYVESWAAISAADWIVTNPPFSLAPWIVPLAFEHARVGIAMLLRKSYTEPCLNRQDWLLAHKKNLANQIFLPRISFTGDGKTDNVACDWFVWTRQEVSGCQVDWIMQ